MDFFPFLVRSAPAPSEIRSGVAPTEKQVTNREGFFPVEAGPLWKKLARAWNPILSSSAHHHSLIDPNTKTSHIISKGINVLRDLFSNTAECLFFFFSTPPLKAAHFFRSASLVSV